MIIFFYLFALFSLASCLLLDDCQKTPFWKLNLCEINCDKCGANGICENCPDGFNLTQSKCETDSDLIYHNSYFTAAQINSSAINQNMFKASNQYLSLSNIVRICQSNSYKFDMIGLFKQQTRVTFNMNFDSPVTEISIRFNFITLFNNTKLEMVLNGEQVHQVVVKNSGFNNTYQASQDSINYLSIPSLKQSSAKVIINKVQTNPIPFSTSLFNKNNELRFQITYLTNITSTTNFWGFSDFSVVAKKCEDCIPERLKTLSSNVGIAIGITAGALLILILIMYGCVKLQEKKRLNSNQQVSGYDSFNQNQQKQQEREEEKQNDLKIRQTIKNANQRSKNSKKNKIT